MCTSANKIKMIAGSVIYYFPVETNIRETSRLIKVIQFRRIPDLETYDGFPVICWKLNATDVAKNSTKPPGILSLLRISEELSIWFLRGL